MSGGARSSLTAWWVPGTLALCATALALVLVALTPTAGARRVSGRHSRVAGRLTGALTAGSGTGCETVAPPPTLPHPVPPPAKALDPARRYTLTFTTNCGQIRIALSPHTAPLAAANVASLAEHGFYDDLTFYRIAPDYLIQAGTSSLARLPNGYSVMEPPAHRTTYRQGAVVMARVASAPSGSAGSDFFIVVSPRIGLPARFATIGHVVEGLDTVARISEIRARPARDGAPTMPVVIQRAAVTTR